MGENKILYIVKNPIIEGWVYDLRNPKTDNERFRSRLESVGFAIGMQIAANLPTKEAKVKTVLDEYAKHNILAADPVLLPVLRAGVPLGNGLHKAFINSYVGPIGAMRDEDSLKATLSYKALPDLEGKIAILADTMIATGGSVIDTVNLVKGRKPGKIIVAGAMAAKSGIDRIESYDKDIDVYVAALDPVLNDNGYIVPGLGDAGDRCFGEKTDKA